MVSPIRSKIAKEGHLYLIVDDSPRFVDNVQAIYDWHSSSSNQIKNENCIVVVGVCVVMFAREKILNLGVAVALKMK